MTDPRWQRAMERLGLPHAPQTGMRSKDWLLDPDDPATFLRVVEALTSKAIPVFVYRASENGGPCTVEIGSPEVGPEIMGHANSLSVALYEAVMEAFGREQKD